MDLERNHIKQSSDRMPETFNRNLPNQRKYAAKSPYCCQSTYKMTLIGLVFINSLAIIVSASSGHLHRTIQSNETDLELMPDFRAVKLRWTYKNEDELNSFHTQPEAFLIRYCELTSWSVQIKCRQKHMNVKHNDLVNGSEVESVINRRTFDQVYPVVGTQNQFEAQIYDLRALTNYTFDVERADQLLTESSKTQHINSRSPSARRLDLSNDNKFMKQIETKPFRAEATKCLADTSEVVVNTGRYFGGRISVEDSSDPRCNLVGNKSSEQSSYLFRINHEICNSKIVDGNRVETMVLVHENKDILTHNTARFLVLCNFSQKSFTLRASISLPKVNGLLSHQPAQGQAQLPTRQAMITSLVKRPSNRLAATGSSDLPDELAKSDAAVNSSDDQFEKLTGSTDRRVPRVFQLRQSSRQVKQSEADEFATNNHQSSSNTTTGNSGIISSSLLVKGRVRSGNLVKNKEEDNHQSSLSPPKPVEVQSKVLYVVRGDPVSGNPAMATVISANAEELPSKMESIGSQLNVTINEIQANSQAKTIAKLDASKRNPKSVAIANTNQENLDDTSAITLTNNHRVSADYATLAQIVRKQKAKDEFSIKYSADKVDEFPVGSSEGEKLEHIASQPVTTRSRSGRMRFLPTYPMSSDLDQTIEAPLTKEPRKIESYSKSSAMNRMGEMQSATDGDLSVSADSSMSEASRILTGDPMNFNSTTSNAAQHPNSLAHNVTSYLLKWSLKALTNLARKSLESLADQQQEDLNTTDFQSKSLPDRPLSLGEMHVPATKSMESSVPMTSSTRRQLIATSTTTPPKPLSTLKSRQDDSPATSDGILFSRRRVGDQPAGSISHLSRSPEPQPATTVTKSQFPVTGHERLQKIETESSIEFNNPRQLRPPPTYSPMASDKTANERQNHKPNNSNYQFEDQHNPRSASLLSWFLYSLITVVGLACIVSVLIWLTFSYPEILTSFGSKTIIRQRDGSLAGPLEIRNYDTDSAGSSPLPHASKSSTSMIPSTTLYSAKAGHINPIVTSDESYEKYDLPGSDKFNEYPSKAIQNLMSNNKCDMSKRSSRVNISENECKGSEFIYTEHVLINSENHSLGESFA